MNVDELWAELGARGARNQFALNSTPRTGSGLPNDAVVVEPVEDGRWTVYYTERGGIFDQRFFDSEDDACRYALTQVVHPQGPGRQLTDDEADQAARLRAQEEESRLAMLRELGIDPGSAG